MDVQKLRDRIKKIEKDLINAKTNHEYKELLKVKAQHEKDIINIEDKILELMEEIEALEEEKKKLEELLDKEVKVIEEKIAKKEKEKEETQQKLEELIKQKEEFKKSIEPNLLKKYELIKKRVNDGIVIATVDDNICSGCFMIIPPKLLNELIKNKDKLYQCPNCGRFLYYKE
jgi:predicted  nucleic acid-binding Zn-ribbon protein